MTDDQNEVIKQLFNAPSLRMLPDIIFFNLVNGAIVPTDQMGLLYTKDEIREVIRALSCYVELFPDIQVETCREEFYLKYNSPSENTNNFMRKGDGYVYLLSRNDGAYKIGYSKNPEKRVKSIKREFPSVELEYYFPADEANEAEYELHIRYQNKRLGQEWFRLSSDDIKYVKSIIKYSDREFVIGEQ